MTAAICVQAPSPMLSTLTHELLSHEMHHVPQGNIYQELAAADKVSLNPPATGGDGTTTGSSNNGQASQAFSLQALSGDYRRIVHKPEDLKWKLLEYNDPDEPLALSELEILSGGKQPAALQGETNVVVWHSSQKECQA